VAYDFQQPKDEELTAKISLGDAKIEGAKAFARENSGPVGEIREHILQSLKSIVSNFISYSLVNSKNKLGCFPLQGAYSQYFIFSIT